MGGRARHRLQLHADGSQPGRQPLPQAGRLSGAGCSGSSGGTAFQEAPGGLLLFVRVRIRVRYAYPGSLQLPASPPLQNAQQRTAVPPRIHQGRLPWRLPGRQSAVVQARLRQRSWDRRPQGPIRPLNPLQHLPELKSFTHCFCIVNLKNCLKMFFLAPDHR